MQFDRLPPAPTVCPYGHRLGPGLVLVGWRPCKCPGAAARHGGHTTWQCRVCEGEYRTVIAYQPAHRRSADEVAAAARWLRLALDRAERSLAAATSQGWLLDARRGRVAQLRKALSVAEREVVVLRSAERRTTTG